MRLLSEIHDSSDAFAASSANAAGLLTIKITESPLRNILLTYLSLLMAMPLVFPFPPLDVSVHISFTSSNSLKFKHTRTETIVSKNLCREISMYHQYIVFKWVFGSLQIHVSVVRLDSPQEFVVVSDVHENLGVPSDCPIQNTERTRL